MCRHWVHAINSFGIAPALLYEVELAMEFWKIYNSKAMGLACSFKYGLDMCKVRLVEQNAAAAKINGRWCAIKIFTFSFKFPHILQVEAVFLEKYNHTFEDTNLFMSFWEIELLNSSIR